MRLTLWFLAFILSAAALAFVAYGLERALVVTTAGLAVIVVVRVMAII